MRIKNYKLFTIFGQSAGTEERLLSCSVSSRLFTKLVLEAPVITESALEVIRRYCEDEVSEIITCLSLQIKPALSLILHSGEKVSCFYLKSIYQMYIKYTRLTVDHSRWLTQELGCFGLRFLS